jgi:hypothetical protein
MHTINQQNFSHRGSVFIGHNVFAENSKNVLMVQQQQQFKSYCANIFKHSLKSI